AMYQVKARRGNGLCFFDPRMQVAINDRAQLEADLHEALAQKQFALHYQPQFTLEGCIVGAEVLLRWQHPQRGMVPPGQFIAVAEESDLILHIGLWVLRTACAQMAVWQDEPQCSHLQLSVNVSARQFRHPDFVRQVTDALQETGAKAHLLTLELTESLVLDNVDESIEKMHQLRTKGVRFSVDDFGTGYSSLAYLTRLPLHQLKIDQSFVRNLGTRETDDVIVQTIIGMGRNLDLEVIAEGVETQGQKDFLALHGCDLYQGYLLGRPMPLDAFDGLMKTPA
ncbi:MAG TPA: EAL domain-containing protein, partial [Giesbergeria sp.]|nr:EAL domain-containing protein [Giesbergeria sp.]HRA13891.1 EAL domain-containing protein [Giesbergeria sp.]